MTGGRLLRALDARVADYCHAIGRAIGGNGHGTSTASRGDALAAVDKSDSIATLYGRGVAYIGTPKNATRLNVAATATAGASYKATGQRRAAVEQVETKTQNKGLKVEPFCVRCTSGKWTAATVPYLYGEHRRPAAKLLSG